MWNPIIAISLGVGSGALLRWKLGAWFNDLFPSIPPGTLAANLIGGCIIGLAVAYFAQAPNIAPERRLLIITGFCGGLTTFSTFSAEVVALLQEDSVISAMSAIGVHVTGSLFMTLEGLTSWQLLKHT